MKMNSQYGLILSKTSMKVFLNRQSTDIVDFDVVLIVTA